MNIEKLLELMKEKSVNQAKLAEDTGVSQAAISKIINGYKDHSVRHLKRIAEYFKVSIDELVN